MTTTLAPSAAASAEQTASERSFKTWDGAELFYRAWLPTPPARATRTIVLIHRGHEHSGRFEDIVPLLVTRETAQHTSIFAWDARGHGRSPGLRGYGPSFGAFVRDLDCFIRHICQVEDRNIEDVAVIGHSVGAVIVAAWVHDYAAALRAVVLATPALRVKLYIPLAIPGLRVFQRVRGRKPTFIKSFVKSRLLTHDAEQQRRYDADPLIERSIAVNILLGLRDTGDRLIADAGAITVPMLVLSGGADWVVDVRSQRRFFERLGSSIKRMRIFEGMYHDILHEAGRDEVLKEIRDFLDARFAARPERASLREAHRRGYTFDEFERLKRPLPAFSPRAIAYAAQRASLATLGRLSEGIRAGWRHGFDSGKSLDYVYDNRARGQLGIGRLFDRAYLDTPGWRGIRTRREHLRALVLEAIRRVAGERGHAHILELAAGCGRYTLDAIAAAKAENIPVTATLRDWDPGNLAQAEVAARAVGLSGIAFEPADAFDEHKVASATPRPNVAVVSGLYELFPDNTLIERSLRGLAAALPPGGYLVYTNQPWHPQVELIARTLTNRDGHPWIMRRRTQAEMHELVGAAGFEPLEMLIDDDGLFSVTLARRIAHDRTSP